MNYDMDENWIVYRDDIIPADNYDVVSVSQECDGTRIVLEGNKVTLQIQFWGVDSLRITDEGKRIRTYNEVENLQEYRKNFIGKPLYTVDNSEFLDWLKKESAGFYTDFVHYTIVTIDDIVDIATTFPPEITVKHICVQDN